MVSTPVAIGLGPLREQEEGFSSGSEFLEFQTVQRTFSAEVGLFPEASVFVEGRESPALAHGLVFSSWTEVATPRSRPLLLAAQFVSAVDIGC